MALELLLACAGMAAVNAADDGDTIKVRSGMYVEHIIISKDNISVYWSGSREYNYK